MGLFGRTRRVGEPGAPAEELVSTLIGIGQMKRGMALGHRADVNKTGLYVQYRIAGKAFRLEAGTKWTSFLDVRGFTDQPMSSWSVKKFEPGPWTEEVGAAYQAATEALRRSLEERR